MRDSTNNGRIGTESDENQSSSTSSETSVADVTSSSSFDPSGAISMREVSYPDDMMHHDHDEPFASESNEPSRLTAMNRPSIKAGLRKGKWTPEEELYTNKVIEVFNAGLLKLGDHERGITLRAYLAEKLNCDPMRITKKYTGASCLGKRVYHFDYQRADNEEAERARRELQILENNFRMKLEVMNKKRMCDARPNGDGAFSISTPAIDALLHRNHNNMMMPLMLPSGAATANGFNPSTAYPMPFFTAGGAAATQSQRPHFIPLPSTLYGQILVEAKANSSDAPAMKEAPFLRGPNGEIFLPPGFGPIHFMPPNARPVPNPYFNPSAAPMNRPPMAYGPVQVPIASAADLRLPFFPTMGRAPSWKDFAGGAAMMPSNSTSCSDEHRDKKARVIKRSPSSLLLERDQSQENLFNIAALDEDSILSKKIEHAESDQNEAASSLLGFIDHVRRNSSHEDLLEFLEGVQKSTSTNNILDSPMPSTAFRPSSDLSSPPVANGFTGQISVK